MKKVITILTIVFLSMNAIGQKINNQYPKPFQIDYGTKKTELIQKMKLLGFERNSDYVGLIYPSVRFMGNEKASATFDFDSFGRMINCEIFCSFDDMMSADLWCDYAIDILHKKYSNGKVSNFLECKGEYKTRNDSITVGEILKGIKEDKITKYTDIEYKKLNHVILIHFEVTGFESVRISFNDVTMQNSNELIKNKRNSNDI